MKIKIMKMIQNVLIDREKCFIHVLKYPNGRTCLQAFSDSDGIPYAKLTVNLVNEEVNENEIFLDVNNIRSVLKDLRAANLIEEIVGVAQSGFVLYPKVKLKL